MTDASSAGLIAEAAVLSHVLAGDSVIDAGANRLATREQVYRFLRVLRFDPDNPMDTQALERIRRQATLYLTEVLRYRVVDSVLAASDVTELFLIAAAATGQEQKAACMTLKAMHVIHHLACRELVFNLPISDSELLSRLNTKVFEAVDAMRAAGIGIEGFATGKKTHDSMVTKLLARRDNLAAHVFDKLRFRIVASKPGDLIGCLRYLLAHLIPYNFVIPGQSQNRLITKKGVLAALGLDPEIVYGQLGRTWWTARSEDPVNEFSGSSFRCVNFVADIPIRVDDLDCKDAHPIAVMQAEIQLVDVKTDQKNNTGDNAHALYKKRQRARVRQRLEGPGVLPPELSSTERP